MTEMLPFLIGALIGCGVGVFLMCLMAVARTDNDDELICTRECLARRGVNQCTGGCEQGRRCTCGGAA